MGTPNRLRREYTIKGYFDWVEHKNILLKMRKLNLSNQSQLVRSAISFYLDFLELLKDGAIMGPSEKGGKRDPAWEGWTPKRGDAPKINSKKKNFKEIMKKVIGEMKERFEAGQKAED